MKKTGKLVTKSVLLSMIFIGGVVMAASGDDETYKNLTLEERLYQYDGFGAQWGFDVGSDGLWLVPKVPTEGTYSAPLKLRNAAADNTLVVGGNNAGTAGYVGIGTDTPAAKLDVKWSGSNTVGDGLTNLLVLETGNTESDKDSDAGFVLRNGREGKQWNFRTFRGGQGFAATMNGTDGAEFYITNTTSNYSGVNLYLGSGASCVNGVWTNTSSRASKENIKILSSEDALQAFHQLQPVTYNYKTDKTESYAGFIAEDVPELVAVNGRDGLSAMDMVAVLTKVVQEQDRKITELEAKQEEITILKKRVASLELLLTNLALNTDGAKKEKVSMK